MPGPREYRIYALQCAEMAGRARKPQHKTTLLQLSANWAKLAVDLEAAEAWLGCDIEDVLADLPDEMVSTAIH